MTAKFATQTYPVVTVMVQYVTDEPGSRKPRFVVVNVGAPRSQRKRYIKLAIKHLQEELEKD